MPFNIMHHVLAFPRAGKEVWPFNIRDAINGAHTTMNLGCWGDVHCLVRGRQIRPTSSVDLTHSSLSVITLNSARELPLNALKNK